MRKKLLTLLLSLALLVTLMPMPISAATETNMNRGYKAAKRNRCLPAGSFDLVTIDDVAASKAAAKRNKATKLKASDSPSDAPKTMPLLLITVGFNNMPYDNYYDWGKTVFSKIASDWSLTKFYSDNSAGKFTFEPAREISQYGIGGNTNIRDAKDDGIVHVALDMDHDDWTLSSDKPDEQSASWTRMISAAMNAADEYVDFSIYDSDNDGSIETNEMAVGFIIAGGDASNAGNEQLSSAYYLTWPHASTMEANCDEKKIGSYVAIAENYIFNDGSFMQENSEFMPYSESWSSTAKDIALNSKKIEVNTAEAAGLFKFRPSASGWYAFYSESVSGSKSDPACRVVSQTGEQIAFSDDDSDNDDDGYQFKAVFYGKAGSTYYLQTINMDSDAVFYVGLVKTTEPDNDDEYEFDEYDESWADDAIPITLNLGMTVDTSEEDGLFIFAPENSGWYSFYSEDIEGSDNGDPLGRVLDSNGKQIAYNDDQFEGRPHFDTDFYAEEGKIYYLQAGSNYEDGKFSVKLIATAGSKDDDPSDPQNEQAGISTLAHELGHYLGLPDYYDTDYDASGAWGMYEVGALSVMAGGNLAYVKNGEQKIYRPSAFDAYSKIALGWVDPVEADAVGEYDVAALNAAGNTAGTVLKIPVGGNKEYYLIENRRFTGWDESLKTAYPKDDVQYYNEDGTLISYEDEDFDHGSYTDEGGLVIWHVDESVFDDYKEANRVNTCEHRPALMPVFMEYDNYPAFKFIGSKPDIRKGFFDENIYGSKYSNTAGTKLFLPVYKGKDKPSARTKRDRGITISGTGSTIKVGVEGLHEHSIEKVDAVTATCDTAGNNEYWLCRECMSAFTDEALTNETTVEEQTLKAIGHDYAWESISDSRHSGVCSRDETHTVIEDHTWNAGEITKEAVGTEKGTKLFTSTKCGKTKEEEYSASTPPGTEYDKAAADAVSAAINAIPAADKISVKDKASIKAARKAYDALTPAQKALVSIETLEKLETAEAALAKAELEKASYINKTTVKASDIRKASYLGVVTVTLGPKVKKISKRAFKRTKIKTIIVKTRKLKAKKIKGSLKESKVKTIKVKVSKKKKINRKYIRKYRKLFTKKRVGKKVTVK